MITWKATVIYFGDHSTKLDEVCGVTENTIYIHVLDEHGEPPFFQSLYLFICSFDLWKKGDFNISLSNVAAPQGPKLWPQLPQPPQPQPHMEILVRPAPGFPCHMNIRLVRQFSIL
jgi:hypothetical protein